MSLSRTGPRVFLLKFILLFFFRFSIMINEKKLQKSQSVPHKNKLAWLGIRITTRATKPKQRTGGKWKENNGETITRKQCIVVD